MTRKRLILHIGGAKCGSSAIQQFLAQNRGALARNGLLCPRERLDEESPVSGHQIWFFESILKRPDWPDIVRRRLGRLGKRMDASGQHSIVISAENLSNYTGLADGFALAAVGFDLRVVCYIRRQDDYFLSAWQQWKLKTHEDLGEYVRSRAGHDADWHGMVTDWEARLGRQAITLRRFDRKSLIGGDVVQDFFQTLQLSTEGCTPLGTAANRSLDEHLGDLAHRARDLFDGPHDNALYAQMSRLIGERAYKSRKASHLMSLEERADLLAHYAQGNEALKRDYFPELGNSPLFPPPGPSDVAELSDIEKLQGENVILLRAICALAQRLEDRDR